MSRYWGVMLCWAVLASGVAGQTTERIEQLPYYQEKDCGAVALAVAFRLRGLHIDLDQLRKEVKLDNEGASAATLVDVIKAHQLSAVGVAIDAATLAQRGTLAIIDSPRGHFAVYAGTDKKTGKMLIIDPPGEPRLVAPSDLESTWGGRAILFCSPESLEPEPAPGGQVTLTPKTVDLGEQWQGDMLSCTFVVHNGGTTPVSLLDTRACCGCGATMPPRRTLGAGEEAVIAVQCQTKHVNRRTWEFAKDVAVVTSLDDPKLLIGMIKANLKPRYLASPEEMDFMAVPTTAAESLKQAADIEFLDAPDTEIVSVDTSADYLQANARRAADPGKWSLDVSIASLPRRLGQNYAYIHVATNNEHYKRISIPVSLEIDGPYRPNVDRITIGVCKPAQKVTRRVQLWKRPTAGPFEVTGVNCPMQSVSVSRKTSGTRDEHQLEITIVTPKEPGKFESELEVTLDNGFRICLPISGFVHTEE